jgi:hypothetical protein
VHSHEEDTAGEKVFRRIGWRLPPARGRTAFEIKPDGEFVSHGPGPGDASASRAGRWSAVAPDRIEVSLPGQSAFELRIASVEPDALRLSR